MGDIWLYIFAAVVALVIVSVILVNIRVRKDIKLGKITKEDLEEVERERKIW